MDYIEKAVERIEADVLSPIVDEKLANVQHIRYGNTRRVEVDPEVLEQNRILHFGTTEEITMAYKLLRTRVLQRMRQNESNTLALTSPGKAAGKTLTAINLALSMAEKLDYTVLLVDLDFRKPTIKKYLGLDAKAGLSDFLLHDVPLHEILIHPGIDRLVVLPQVEKLNSPSELLSSPKMAQLVEEIKHRYPSRMVIFDMPPVLVADDVVAFSAFVENVLLVVEDGETTADDLRSVTALLEDTKLIGTVLNKASDSEETGGYGYY